MSANKSIGCSKLRKEQCGNEPRCTWTSNGCKNEGTNNASKDRNNKHPNQAKESGWHNLPVNVQRLIAQRVNAPQNQARMAAVSRNMHAVAPKINYAPKTMFLLSLMSDIIKMKTYDGCALKMSYGSINIIVSYRMVSNSYGFSAHAIVTPHAQLSDTFRDMPGYIISESPGCSRHLAEIHSPTLPELATRLKTTVFDMTASGEDGMQLVPNYAALVDLEDQVDHVWPAIALDSFDALEKGLVTSARNHGAKPRLDIELNISGNRYVYIVPQAIKDTTSPYFDIFTGNNLVNSTKLQVCKRGNDNINRETFMRFDTRNKNTIQYVPVLLKSLARAPLKTVKNGDVQYKLYYPAFFFGKLKVGFPTIRKRGEEYVRVPTSITISIPENACRLVSVPGQDSTLHLDVHSDNPYLYDIHVDIPVKGSDAITKNIIKEACAAGKVIHTVKCA